MDLKYQKKGETLIVEVDGRLDVVAASVFDAECAQRVEEGERAVVFDLGGLEYISSAGLRSILIIAKNLKAKGGRFQFCKLSPTVKKIFKMSGFDSYLPICDTIEDALSRI